MERTPGYVGPDPGIFTVEGKAAVKSVVKPDTRFGKPSKTLNKNKARDEKRAAALAAALAKLRPSYVYTSGNLRSRIEGRKTSNMESA